MRYEIRQIDAWPAPGGGWIWNDAWTLGEFRTNSKDVRKAFTNAMRRLGIRWPRSYHVVEDTDILEVQHRFTEEPLFAAVPVE